VSEPLQLVIYSQRPSTPAPVENPFVGVTQQVFFLWTLLALPLRVAVLERHARAGVPVLAHRFQTTRESRPRPARVSTQLDCMLSALGASNCNGASTYAVFSSNRRR
jgi:hypothetical protein